jgi:hypothetical protein
VMSALSEVVARGEMDYLRAQLSADYEAVLPEGDAPALRRGDEAEAGTARVGAA